MAVTTTDIQYNNSKLHNALNDSGYICSPDFTDKIVTAINTKPVSGAFLYGMAGTGKSYLPMVLAEVLERQLFVHQCTQGTREEDLLVKIMPSEDTKSGVSVGHGKLFQAAVESKERPVMLMLDEWDKTRPSVDGFFLDFLQYGRLSLPGIENGNVQANLDNLTVFITANDEREFHEALLRRFPMVHVNPIEPADVVSALNLTHKGNIYIPQMVDLYTRSLQAKLPKPATIQELRQLLDAIDLLGGRADWDSLVYQYVTKTPENHIMLCNQEKVSEIDTDSIKKLEADDYGVDIVPLKKESDEPEMPDLRNLNQFDSSYIKSQYVPDNATVVLNRKMEGSDIYTNSVDDLMMKQDMDNDGPEMAAMPDWGVITEDYAFINDEITSCHVSFIDRVNFFQKLTGEVKIVDKYATKKEVNRMLHSKWTVYKRDKTEIIARLKNTENTDLRYREGKGLEIIAKTSTNLLPLFQMNQRENLASINISDNITRNSLTELSYKSSTNLAVAKLDEVVFHDYKDIGNSVLKSFEKHNGYCEGIWLRAPNGKSSCKTIDIPLFDELVHNANTYRYKVHSRPNGFMISSKNIDVLVHDIGDRYLGLMKLHINGVVNAQLMHKLLHWFPRIPIYKCFKHDGRLRENLRKAGWVISRGNVNTLKRGKIFAHIVYDYVIFCTFIDSSIAFTEDTQAITLEMKQRIGGIKALEKRYKPIKD